MSNNYLTQSNVSPNGFQRQTTIQGQIPFNFSSSQSTLYGSQTINNANIMKTIIPESQDCVEKNQINISQIFKYLKNNNYFATTEALLSEINEKRKKPRNVFYSDEEYNIEEYVDEYRKLLSISDGILSEKYSKFRDWTLNSISSVREELLSICFVLFIQIYLIFLKRGENSHRRFFDKFAEDFAFSRYREIVSLLRVSDEIEKLKEIDLLKPYIESKFHIILRPISVSLLNSYLLTSEESSIISIIQERLVIHMHSNINEGKMSNCKKNQELLKFSKEVGTFQLGEIYSEDSISLNILSNNKTNIKKEAQDEKENSKSVDSSLSGKSIGLSRSTYKWGLLPENFGGIIPKENELKKSKWDRFDQEVTENIKGLNEVDFLPIDDLSNPFTIRYKKHVFNEVSTRQFLDVNQYPSIITNNLSFVDFNEVIDIDISHNHVLGAFCTDDGYIQVYDMKDKNNRINPAWIHKNRVQRIRFHPWNQELLLSGGLDSKLNLSIISKDRSKTSLAKLVTYNGHSSNSCIWDLCWDDFGISFISGSSDKTARLWCTSRTYPIRIFSGHLSDVMSVTVHPNSSIVATGGGDGQIIIWDVRTGSKEGVIQNGKVTPGMINQVKFGHNGYFLASSTICSNISYSNSKNKLSVPIWDIRKLSATSTRYYQLCKFPKNLTNKNRSTFIKSIDFSYGSRILASVTNNSIVSLWDTSVETALNNSPRTNTEFNSTSIYKIKDTNSKNLKFLPSNLLSISSVKIRP